MANTKSKSKRTVTGRFPSREAPTNLRPGQQIDAQVNRIVDLEKLLAQMDFSSDNILEASLNQSKLYLQASSLHTQAIREQIAAENALVVKKAEISENIRAQAKAMGDKLSEAAIDRKRRVSPDITPAQDRYERSVVRKEWTWNLLEALRHRRDAIRVTSDLSRAELSVSSSREGV